MAEHSEPTPLLDLKTLVERPTIAIDGELYEILSPDELSIVDCHRFAAWGNRIDALMAKKALTKSEKKELGKILGDLSDKIMAGVPEALRAKLTDPQRMAVAEVFTRLPLQKRLARLGAGGTTADGSQSRPTGASSSRGSSASTAADPAGGSSAAPSPSCGPTSR